MTGRGDKFIKLGFWSQLVLLFLVDWGSLLAFAKYEVGWYHYVGFTVVNGLLLWATWVMWGWLKPQRTPAEPPIGGGEE
jgi:hypothetical protein